MGLLDKVLKTGLDALSDAVEDKVTDAARKTAAKAVDAAATGAVKGIDNAVKEAKADAAPAEGASAADAAAAQAQASGAAAGGSILDTIASSGAQAGGLFASLQQAAMGFAGEAAKSMKICPKCGEPAGAGEKFCPSCGAELPAQTVAEGAVCPKCGKQNTIGMKFCSDCGTKLPAAVAEEQAKAESDAAALQRWQELLPQIPQWNQGGSDFSLEVGGTNSAGNPFHTFTAEGVDATHLAAYNKYLKENGFRTAGEYPSEDQLFKRVDGQVYNVDSSCGCSEGTLSLILSIREPSGGFDYVKPQPKKTTTLKDLLGL